VFSKRTRWPREENALSRAAERTRRGTEPFFDLTVSNPTRIAPYEDAARARILSALADPRGLEYTPEPLGAPAAREAVSRYCARRGIEVSPERLMLVASTSEAYAMLFRLLCEPGDRVLVPKPSYPLFDFLTGLSDVEAAHYRLSYDGSWFLDRESFRVDERTRAALVVSPNNPTGSLLSDEERTFVTEALVGGETALISDEVFSDFTSDGSLARASWISKNGPLGFSLNGLSKIAGLPQLKLGWIVISGHDEAVREARARLEIIGDTYLSVATPVQLALDVILEEAEAWQAGLRSRIAENRRALDELTAGTSCRPLLFQGGWSFMLELPRTRTDEEWAVMFAEQARVLTHPGYLFDVEDRACVVLSAIQEASVFRAGVEQIVSRLS
jgi:aspartate/methionine/tyrosine aminotransferase